METPAELPTGGGPSTLLHVSERGTGPPVLLVHGQPGLGTDWGPVAELLGGDHRLVVPDRPGYGRSGGPARSMADNAQLLAEVLLERSAAPAVVVGHSYGGGIALLMAARRPEVVRGLVLVASVGLSESVNGLDHLLALRGVGEALSAATLFTLGRLLPRLRLLDPLLPHRARERLRAVLPDDRYAPTLTQGGRRLWRSFVCEQRFLIDEIGEVERALAAVAAPTSVVTGTWDVVVPATVSADLAAAVAGAELLTVAHAGHFLPRDLPAVVAGAVRRVEARTA